MQLLQIRCHESIMRSCVFCNASAMPYSQIWLRPFGICHFLTRCAASCSFQGPILCPSRTGTTSRETTSSITRFASWTAGATTSPPGPSSRPCSSWCSITPVRLRRWVGHQTIMLQICSPPSLSNSQSCGVFFCFCPNSQGCRAVLPADRAVPQRHAPPDRPVRQNQRRVGDPAGVAAAHQAPRQRPVWRSVDGCVSFWEAESRAAASVVGKRAVCVGSRENERRPQRGLFCCQRFRLETSMLDASQPDLPVTSRCF